MPLNIPSPRLPLSGLNQAISTGGNLYSKIINPVLHQQEQQRQWKQHLNNLMLQKEQLHRAGANDDLKRKILGEQLTSLEHANDPNYKFQQIQSLLEHLSRLQNKFSSGNGVSENQEPQNNGNDFLSLLQLKNSQQGQGALQEESPFLNALSENQSQEPQVPQSQQAQPSGQSGQLPGGIDINDIIKGLVYKSAGLQPPKTGQESPEQKRNADLQYKVAFENEKKKLGDEKERDKVINNAKNDIPHLQQSIDALKRAKKIIKNNPDLFGHFIYGHDLSAKLSDNPNSGKLTSLLNKFILDTEKSVSSRGSQLALKFAINQKPNYSETQASALGKTTESIRMLEEALKDATKLSSGNEPKELTYNPKTGRLE